MKKLSTLIASFVLLGTLVSCGSGNSTSSGTSTNPGSVVTPPTTGISNQCTTALKQYIENYTDALYFFYNGSTSVTLNIAVAEAEKLVYPNGQAYYRTVAVDRETDVVVERGSTKSFLIQLASTASSCSQQYNGFLVKVANTQYFIANNLPLEANPVERLTETSANKFEYRVIQKFIPNKVNYKEYSWKDIWDKIF